MAVPQRLGIQMVSNALSDLLREEPNVFNQFVEFRVSPTGADTFYVQVTMGEVAYATYLAELMSGSGRSLRDRCMNIVGNDYELKFEVIVTDQG